MDLTALRRRKVLCRPRTGYTMDIREPLRSRDGFTLIELIIVIAILAFVTVVGIRSYGNLRDVQARKMNAANIKRVEHALATYEIVHRENGTAGYFKNFDSLIDV